MSASYSACRHRRLRLRGLLLRSERSDGARRSGESGMRHPFVIGLCPLGRGLLFAARFAGAGLVSSVSWPSGRGAAEQPLRVDAEPCSPPRRSVAVRGCLRVVPCILCPPCRATASRSRTACSVLPQPPARRRSELLAERRPPMISAQTARRRPVSGSSIRPRRPKSISATSPGALSPRPQGFEHLYRGRDAGLFHQYRLEAPFQHGVLLDVLAVLRFRRRHLPVRHRCSLHPRCSNGRQSGAQGGAKTLHLAPG